MNVLQDRHHLRVTCPFCDSLLEITKDDLHRGDLTPCGRGINPTTYTCGACSRVVGIGYKEEVNDLFAGKRIS